MSVRFVPVSWNRSKLVYDIVLLAAVFGYLYAYLALSPAARAADTALDAQSLAIRAWGSCAFLLLTVTLAVGPLARLDRRFLPLLYNRRHLGVVTATVATAHAAHVLGWYFAFSPVPALEALFAADANFGQVRGFPFILFGVAALVILWALAFTSHDFWLGFLSPSVWKTLHMGVYAAYALIVAHIAFGALQDARAAALPVLVVGSVALVAGLHVAAGLRARRELASGADPAPWVDAGSADGIAEGRGRVVHFDGAEAVAIFRHRGRLSAVSNLCAHQNGPLGEGKVVGGCITCPWHGYQYRLRDGCAPPPYTENLATYRLRIKAGRVLLDPRPNPPGTPVEPVALPEGTT